MADTKEALPVRWYSVDSSGLATLCADERDARTVAADSAATFGRQHRAVQLCDIAELRAEVERLRVDAERYRLWRDRFCSEEMDGVNPDPLLYDLAETWDPHQVDALIDAAMKKDRT